MSACGWIESRNDARKLELELILKRECQRARGMTWLSTRTLCRRMMHRDVTQINQLRRELVADGKLRFVSAPGRGRGRGRTLYWLPGVSEKAVLRVLREEHMPEVAIAQARAFFVCPKNDLVDDRQESLQAKAFVSQLKKDARARAPSPSPPLNGPPRPRPQGQPATSSSPSLGRLARHGFVPISPVASLLSAITDNPSTHPIGCGCGAHET